MKATDKCSLKHKCKIKSNNNHKAQNSNIYKNIVNCIKNEMHMDKSNKKMQKTYRLQTINHF